MAEKMGRGAEKSNNFSIACSLLSQYFKQRGNQLGDLNLAPRLHEAKETPTTMALFPGLDQNEKVDVTDQLTTKSQHERNQEKAQLTIFYAGKVIVFDNFPANKVKDLIEMAGSSAKAITDVDQATKSPSQNNNAIAYISGDSKDAQKPAQSAGSNTPGARRASLHRFLEKRKERITAKAPYKVNGSPTKPDESRSRPGSSNELNPQSDSSAALPTLDLN